MKKLALTTLLCVVAATAFALPPYPATRIVKAYCLAATPTVPEAYYVPIAVTALSGVPPTAIDELDEIGRTFRTTLTYSGTDLTATSCPVKQ
jgi:hypothetical protein